LASAEKIPILTDFFRHFFASKMTKGIKIPGVPRFFYAFASAKSEKKGIKKVRKRAIVSASAY